VRSLRLAVLAVLAALAALPAAAGAAPPAVELTAPDPCVAGSCVATVTAPVAAGQALLLEVDWRHAGPAAEGFAPDVTVPCVALSLPAPACSATSPVLAGPRAGTVAVRITGSDGVPAYASRALRVVRPGADPEALCEPRRAAETCGPGHGRRTPGGGEKVSHRGWPAITGILWQVRGSHDASRTGGPRNDELLGHHGSDVIGGEGGRDVLWGDWDPRNNPTRQHDRLDGGAGDDWIYSSHGRNAIRGGAGNDYVWAYYGTGTIDCGPGRGDIARIRLESPYRVRNCERIRNFCGHGSKPGGGCYKPGENPASRRRVG